MVNPISGGRDKGRIPSLINKYLDRNLFDLRISYTEREEHGYMLAKAAIKDQFDIIVAVGGDGTVNEVSRALVHTNVALGIIPFGSGNGLARSLKIPLRTKEAILTINGLKTDCIDSAKLNNYRFFNVAGSGFDAHISQQFASNRIRGFVGYIKTTFQELKKYVPQEYEIKLDDFTIIKKAFIVSIANSSQYGNDAHIAPLADVKDGMLDIVVVAPITWYKIPFLALRMFNKTAGKSKYVEMYKSKNIHIKRELEAAIHIDGEPKLEQRDLLIEIVPKSLIVIIP